MGPLVASHLSGLVFCHRAASGPTALFRNTKAAGAAIGSVKSMLLEWCRAMTRNYEVGRGQGPFRGSRAGEGLSGAKLRGWEAHAGQVQPRGQRLTEAAPSHWPAACGHSEFLVKLEQRHGLLCPHPQVLPRCL